MTPRTGAASRAITAALCAVFAAASGAAATTASTPGDPLASIECRQALGTLNGEEAAVAATARASGAADAGPRVDAAKLAVAQRAAATVCLARHLDPPKRAVPLTRPPPVAAVPLAVAPASMPTTTVPSARAGTSPPVARPAERPYAITSCDAGGCWANDGSRLNRVGPNLWGPRGICTVQGTLLQCP